MTQGREDHGDEKDREESAQYGAQHRAEPRSERERQSALLAALLENVRARVAQRVATLSADDPTAADPFRGLFISPEAAERLLRSPALGTTPVEPEEDPDEYEARPVSGEPPPTGYLRLDLLCARFGLDALDRDLLLLALAPDLDRRFGSLYGYLNDDVGRRRATVGVALDLCGRSTLSAAARARLSAGSPLLSGRLIVLEQTERPFLERELRVPDRVCAHLLGDPGDGLGDSLLPAGLTLHPAQDAAAPASRTATALRNAPARPVHLHCPRAQDGAEPARHACAGLGRPTLHLDPTRAEGEPGTALGIALREARLRDAVLLVGPLPPGGEEPWVRAITGSAGPSTPPGSAPRPRDIRVAVPVPQVLFGTAPFDPLWTDAHLLALPAGADVAGPAGNGPRVWEESLHVLGAPVQADLDLAAEIGVYRMSTAQVWRAARTAIDLAAMDGAPLDAAHLHEAARLQNATGLERHARRVRPAVTLDDLVLPPEPMRRIEELVHRARHREQVLHRWGMRRGGGRGSGVVALFAGDSGTGKTLAAEVVAGALGLDLYVVELSAVVDKYVGETEKNLDRIFAQADAVNAVLLFDEADAVFGKRSEVKDSHDRYANLESAYLLQRLESFDGVAVLTTNLRGNIDEAFTRRLDVAVDFPFPDEEQRRALWEHCLRPPLPCAGDANPAMLAKEFELAGGSIRSAAVTAAYLAAAAGRPVGAAELLEGARREYAKAGRLLPRADEPGSGPLPLSLPGAEGIG